MAAMARENRMVSSGLLLSPASYPEASVFSPAPCLLRSGSGTIIDAWIAKTTAKAEAIHAEAHNSKS
ncbi:hypothetical protein [Congregibacter litoralis]|uniref:hypothetical protein n=1 Tax=Congregibacter litoralis TaxID=393662 RepID=UPI00031AE061|nr:hypothetical protein [Congregibacter litoralis]